MLLCFFTFSFFLLPFAFSFPVHPCLNLLHAYSFIEANVEACGVPEAEAEIWMSDALHFLRRAQAQRQRAWDIAFFDPPYAIDYAPVLSLFGTGQFLNADNGLPS